MEEPKEVNKTEREEIPFEIVLDKKRFGEPLPKGKPGEVKAGFSFFGLRKKEDGSEFWEFLRSEMEGAPALHAVTEEQYKNWQKSKIKAVPADFIWDEKKGLWRIENEANPNRGEECENC